MGWAAEITAVDPTAIFQQQCVNCHDGGKAPSLQNGDFKHGRDDAGLARSIRDGYPETGMPAFGSALSASTIQSLVVFLHERMAKAMSRRKTICRLIPATVHPRANFEPFRIETVVDEGLEVPWSFVFLPDGRILLSERKCAAAAPDLDQRPSDEPEPLLGKSRRRSKPAKAA